MKFTTILLRQHIGFHFKKHWRIQGRVKIRNSGAEKILAEKGIKVYKPEEIFQCERKVFESVEVVGFKPKPIKYDETHPEWHERKICSFEDNEVLTGGLEQAKALTKTIELKKGLPENLFIPQLDNISSECKENLKLSSLRAHLLDAEQKPLPKVKDPQRPMWNFPRDYGVTLDRRCRLLTNKLTDTISLNIVPELGKQRDYWDNVFSVYTFEKDDKLIQLQSTAEKIRTSWQPIKPVTDLCTKNIGLPNLHPMNPTLSMTLKNIYEEKCIYPFPKEIKRRQPHTLFLHFNSSEVKNIYEEEVTDCQKSGRALMKTFTYAASFAKQEFGEGVKVLPRPVTVQCVHTDGRIFTFGILQLQTLDMSDEGIKNLWYQSEFLPLFEKCHYLRGRPVLEGYNELPIRHLVAFAKS